MNRRDAILAMISLMAVRPLSLRAKEVRSPVQLLVVRHSNYVNKCVRCIPGKLYGVPNSISLETAEWTTGLLTELTDVIERSFEQNIKNISSIPIGIYDAHIETKATKKWMWSGGKVSQGEVLLNRAWRIELENVPGKRTKIQFHYGKDVSWSEGCLIIGTSPRNTCHDECKHGDSPEKSVAKLREYVTSNSLASDHPIRVRIADGVFA